MKIPTESWKQLLQSIENNLYTSSMLDVSDMNLNSINAIELAKALKSNDFIKSVDIHNNNIGDIGFKAFLDSSHLTSLDVSHNFIGRPDPKGMAANESLIKLGLEPTYTFHLSSLDSLSHNTSLTHLNISDNQLGGMHEATLVKILVDLPLTMLNIGKNNIHNESVITLAGSTTLENLNVSDTYILASGIYALAQNKILMSLNLSNMPKLNDSDFSNVFAALTHLMKTTTLTTLDLHSDQLTTSNAYIIDQDYKVSHIRANGWDEYWTPGSLKLKQSLLEKLIKNNDFFISLLDNETLINFNIQDQVWDNTAYNKLLASFMGTCFFIAPSKYVEIIQTHLVDNLSKIEAQVSLSDISQDVDLFESNTLVPLDILSDLTLDSQCLLNDANATKTNVFLDSDQIDNHRSILTIEDIALNERIENLQGDTLSLEQDLDALMLDINVIVNEEYNVLDNTCLNESEDTSSICINDVILFEESHNVAFTENKVINNLTHENYDVLGSQSDMDLINANKAEYIKMLDSYEANGSLELYSGCACSEDLGVIEIGGIESCVFYAPLGLDNVGLAIESLVDY